MVCHSLIGIHFSFLAVHKIIGFVKVNVTFDLIKYGLICLLGFLGPNSHRSLMKMETLNPTPCITVKNT